MITRVEALNYRCLHYVSEHLGAFQVLAGPNGSGKSTFLDCVEFMADLVSIGIDAAIRKRASGFHDLVWRRGPGPLELALEARIPAGRIPEERLDEMRLPAFANPALVVVRYEVQIGALEGTEEIGILRERVLLGESPRRPPSCEQSWLWTPVPVAPQTLFQRRTRGGWVVVVNKAPGESDRFYDEAGQGRSHAYRLGPHKCALANLPEDESKYPATTWFKAFLKEGVQRLTLDSTQRLLALTLPPYLPDQHGLFLIEATKNGLHAGVFEAMCQSLSSVQNAQVLLTTHSPAIVSIAESNSVLFFCRNDEGSTTITRGYCPPAAQDWL